MFKHSFCLVQKILILKVQWKGLLWFEIKQKQSFLLMEIVSQFEDTGIILYYEVIVGTHGYVKTRITLELKLCGPLM